MLAITSRNHTGGYRYSYSLFVMLETQTGTLKQKNLTYSYWCSAFTWWNYCKHQSAYYVYEQHLSYTKMSQTIRLIQAHIGTQQTHRQAMKALAEFLGVAFVLSYAYVLSITVRRTHKAYSHAISASYTQPNDPSKWRYWFKVAHFLLVITIKSHESLVRSFGRVRDPDRRILKPSTWAKLKNPSIMEKTQLWDDLLQFVVFSTFPVGYRLPSFLLTYRMRISCVLSLLHFSRWNKILFGNQFAVLSPSN